MYLDVNCKQSHASANEWSSIDMKQSAAEDVLKLRCAVLLDSQGSMVAFLQLLARADNVKEFIRRGETEGFTEITLSSGEARSTVVYRRIRFDERSGGLSDWKLNGAQPCL